MKRLFIAFAFMAMGFSVSANDLGSGKTSPVVIKAEVSSTSIKSNKITAESKAGKGTNRRYQMAFTFYDGCGTKMTVWVSGGHSSTPGDLFGTAYAYAESTMTANGCFPK